MLAFRIIYLILSTCLISVTLININRMANLVVTPIYFNGGSLFSLIPLNDSNLIYLKGPYSCDGMWDCSRQICQLTNKTRLMVGVHLNPTGGGDDDSYCVGDSTDVYEYRVVACMLVISMIITAITFMSKLIIIIQEYMKNDNNKMNDFEGIDTINDIYQSSMDSANKTNMRKIFWIILSVVTRVCVLVTAAVFYFYLVWYMQIDKPQANIKISEYVELCVLLFAVILDGVIVQLTVPL